jgi:hypothetical protein
MLKKMARSAASGTDSESASLARLAIPSVAQVTCLAIRPTARSRARRREDSTEVRILGCRAHRKAVRPGTLFFCAPHRDRHAMRVLSPFLSPYPLLSLFSSLFSFLVSGTGRSFQVRKIIDEALFRVLSTPPIASHVPASQFTKSLRGKINGISV